MSEAAAIDIKEAIKEIIKLIADKKTLQAKIDAINATLVEKGVDEDTEKLLGGSVKVKGSKVKSPEINEDSVVEFIKSNGGKVSASAITAHFGPKANKWKKTNAKKFKIESEGVTKWWSVK